MVLFWAVLLAVSLFTHNGGDPSLNTVVSKGYAVKNAAGVVGAYLSGFLADGFGLGAFLFPLGFAVAGLGCFVRRLMPAWWQWLGLFVFLLTIMGGAASDWGLAHASMAGIVGGGFFGKVLHAGVLGMLQPTGAFILWLFALIAGTQLMVGLLWAPLLRSLSARVSATLATWRENRELRREEAGLRAEERAAEKAAARAEREQERFAAQAAAQDAKAAAKAAAKDDFFATRPAPREDRPAFHSPLLADAPPAEPGPRQARSILTPAEPGPAHPRSILTPAEPGPAHPRSMLTPAEPAPAREVPPPAAPAISVAPPMDDDGPDDDIPPVFRSLEQLAGGGRAEEPMPHAPAGLGLEEPAGLDLDALGGLEREAPGGLGLEEAGEPDDSYASEVPAALNLGGPAPAEPGDGVWIPPWERGKASAKPAAPPQRPAASVAPAAPVAKAPVAKAPAAPPAAPEPPARNGRPAAPRTEPYKPAAPGLTVRKVSREQPAPAEIPMPPLTKDGKTPPPPIEFLAPAPPDAAAAANREALKAQSERLIACLADFGIAGEVRDVVPGPVVTMFEVKPAPGVKISRIENLSDDLALALKATAVRIVAPIPGRDTVGVEIPNQQRKTVYLRDVMESAAFRKMDSLLTLALGQDIFGNPVCADLARMPHLLVAGATGQGKSVCLNCLLMSFLYKARPDQVKLLLVDPKRIELSVYEDLPHLVHPVVTDMSLAKNALDWAVYEMERRYEAMARLGVRNIEGFNAKLAKGPENLPPDAAAFTPLPYLVIVIDEMADLMLTARKEVETSIVRLAQLARAAGIHMILATQRPSVDVVTGLIKANFPSRIAFTVTSPQDSRTILDTVGANQLLGRGDMLFKPGGGRNERVHGALVSEEEIARVLAYWKERETPSYELDFGTWSAEPAAEGGEGAGEGDAEGISDDPVYPDALDFVMQQGKASISLIQRRFRIGFNRAARFVEQMERDGLIGPADGSKPRLVIKGRE